MSTTVALDASPANVLRLFRGSIVDVHGAFPGVLHVEVRDSAGGLWRFTTQDAEYSPSDAGRLAGQVIETAQIDEISGELRCAISDGSSFVVKRAEPGAPDDPPNWELITPTGLALEFGPGLRWQIAGADTHPPTEATTQGLSRRSRCGEIQHR